MSDAARGKPLARIAVDRERIADFSHRHHIRKLSFFGSVLRDDFRAGERCGRAGRVRAGRDTGLFSIVEMEFELEEIFAASRKVNLRTPLNIQQVLPG